MLQCTYTWMDVYVCSMHNSMYEKLYYMLVAVFVLRYIIVKSLKVLGTFSE